MIAGLEWDRRRQLGTFRSYGDSARRLLRAPRATLQVTQEAGPASALLFAAISYGCVLLPSMVFLYFASMARTFPNPVVAVIATLAYGAGGFALLMLQLVSTSAAEWLALRLMRQRQATFRRALQAHALSESAMMLGLFPLVGPPVATIWAIGLRFLAIRQLQRVTTGQAVVAVLAPLLCLCGLIAAGLTALLS
ncbi:MAG: hypothetical protein QM723_00585 [Myxococcaceae bacterium]